jgi:DNA-binding NarL/FixJ family response regulator
VNTPPANENGSPTAVSGIRVLVVDDDKQVGTRLRELLNDFGHTVVGVSSSGIQGIVLIKALRPDVVVSDLRMPGMSGLQLAAEVGRLPSPPAVIIVSAYDDASLKAEAVQAGAVSYVVKGAPGEQIHQAVVAGAATRTAARMQQPTR